MGGGSPTSRRGSLRGQRAGGRLRRRARSGRSTRASDGGRSRGTRCRTWSGGRGLGGGGWSRPRLAVEDAAVQEVEHRLLLVELLLDDVGGVALAVGVELDVAAGGGERVGVGVDLLGGAARVVLAEQDQDGRSDAVDVGDRRALGNEAGRSVDDTAEQGAIVLLERGGRVVVGAHVIADRDERDTG